MTHPVASWLAASESELIAFRRDLHAHPELSYQEVRTTGLVRDRLFAAGLEPAVLPGGRGLTCDVGSGPGPVVALRADLDALPLPDDKDVPYRSTIEGVCHACGHDVHTVAVLGAGLALAAYDDLQSLPGKVRLVFQPAEETMPGGALDILKAGRLDGVASIFALHCDPSLDVGLVGLRAGALTAAADSIEIVLTGSGGHTSRPYLTLDLVHVLAKIAVEVPNAVSRLVDPRAGMLIVWGAVTAGIAPNAIPRTGVLRGTLRTLDTAVWESAPELFRSIVEQVVAPYGGKVEVRYTRGVPPVVNDAGAIATFTAAVHDTLGPGAAVPTRQSLGGEDFAWYLDRLPGAMARLGVRRPGDLVMRDLHQGSFDVDESAIALGAQILAHSALLSLQAPAPATLPGSAAD